MSEQKSSMSMELENTIVKFISFRSVLYFENVIAG